MLGEAHLVESDRQGGLDIRLDVTIRVLTRWRAYARVLTVSVQMEVVVAQPLRAASAN